jgi:hypothetical protein
MYLLILKSDLERINIETIAKNDTENNVDNSENSTILKEDNIHIGKAVIIRPTIFAKP